LWEEAVVAQSEAQFFQAGEGAGAVRVQLDGPQEVEAEVAAEVAVQKVQLIWGVKVAQGARVQVGPPAHAKEVVEHAEEDEE
jgi:hypothetical protein